jgi:glycosyltransferase involved in cell wall biosynthesis
VKQHKSHDRPDYTYHLRMNSVTVITPALPERAAITLPDALASIREQTVQPVDHVVVFDYSRQGSSITRNRALAASRSTWIAPLDDDDIVYPNHLQVLLQAATKTKADVVYSDCDGARRTSRMNRDFDADALRQANFIPATALIRRSVLTGIGGYPETLRSAEDWATWLLLLKHGAKFHHVPKVTWTYRRGNWDSKQKHRGKELAKVKRDVREYVKRH